MIYNDSVMFEPSQPLSQETLDRLNRAVAEGIAKSKPQFYKLEKYRDFIQAHIEADVRQKVLLRVLKDEEGVIVSPDTLSRYIRASGFRPAKSTRRKQRRHSSEPPV